MTTCVSMFSFKATRLGHRWRFEVAHIWRSVASLNAVPAERTIIGCPVVSSAAGFQFQFAKT